MGFLTGKRLLITGARNKWSIAWACAQSARREGADLVYSVMNDREADDLRKMLTKDGVEDATIFLCDATKADELETLVGQVERKFGGQLDGLLHSMAYANREDLAGEFADTSQEGFALANEVSAYTLVALSRAFRPQLQAAGGGAIVTLSYLGAERVVPGYNVMGVAKAALEASVRYLAYDLGKENIRVNAVSAGPIKTLAAQGVKGLGDMIKHVEDRAPLQRAVKQEDVGDVVAFFLSDLARGITGETVYVDAGYHIVGM